MVSIVEFLGGLALVFGLFRSWAALPLAFTMLVATLAVHLLQIWILPEAKGLKPGYEQKHFPRDELRGVLRLSASRGGRDG